MKVKGVTYITLCIYNNVLARSRIIKLELRNRKGEGEGCVCVCKYIITNI